MVGHAGGPKPGIIPADAGSTSVSYIHDYLIEDHPRGCGEHGGDSIDGWQIQGSSPRMRGALRGRRLDRHHHGIIPADAGSTISSSRYQRWP